MLDGVDAHEAHDLAQAPEDLPLGPVTHVWVQEALVEIAQDAEEFRSQIVDLKGKKALDIW